MNIPFYKMHGAANDFILVDDRALTFPLDDSDWLQQVMARHIGIGSEGIILIQPSEDADFRMRFFNPDGNEVEMCGNGARCVARLAHELGLAPEEMRFNTVAGTVGAALLETDIVRLEMTQPRDWLLEEVLMLSQGGVVVGSVNSGVPHVVTKVEDLDVVDVHGLGAELRHHKRFAPDGTNANFIQITGPQSLRIRTYERGVEAETPACGTGIVAGALLAARWGLVEPPVQVTPTSGDLLDVDFRLTEDGAENVTLTGPALHVFKGELAYPG